MRNTLLLCALLLGVTACDGAVQKTDNTSSVHKQVMDRGSIRCGWSEFPPYFMKNADGTYGGLVYDLMQELGQRTSLKIEYVQQVGWGTVVNDIVDKRIDMACSYFWQNSTRGRLVPPSHPIVYDQLWVYMRSNDTRSVTDYEQLNNPEFTFATIDGGAENKVLALHFPKARNFSMGELSTTGEFFEALASGKADFITVDANTAGRYMAQNPDKIKRLEMPAPVHVFPGVMLLPPNDPQFKSMIDVTIKEMDLDGAIDAILQKYDMQDKVSRNIYYK